MNDQAAMMEAGKKRLAEEKAAREKAQKDAGVGDAEGANPTPTQAENDLAKMGAVVIDKAEDGSPPDAPSIDQQWRGTRLLDHETKPAPAPAGNNQPRPQPTPAAPPRPRPETPAA